MGFGEGGSALGNDQETETRIKVRRKKRRRGISGRLRSRKAERLLSAAVTLVAILYVGANALDALQASQQYGGAKLGMSPAEVKAAIGPEDQHAAAPGQAHVLGGRTIVARYAPDGTLDQIECTELPDSLELCPKTMGIRIGTVDRDLILKLGAPDDVTVSGTEKLLHYRGLGLTFQFRQGAVVKMTLSRSDDLFAFVRQVTWLLIP